MLNLNHSQHLESTRTSAFVNRFLKKLPIPTGLRRNLISGMDIEPTLIVFSKEQCQLIRFSRFVNKFLKKLSGVQRDERTNLVDIVLLEMSGDCLNCKRLVQCKTIQSKLKLRSRKIFIHPKLWILSNCFSNNRYDIVYRFIDDEINNYRSIFCFDCPRLFKIHWILTNVLFDWGNLHRGMLPTRRQSIEWKVSR